MVAVLLLPMAPLAAAPPFIIDGLHIHLDFDQAVSRAEALGGVCQLGALRRGEVLTAQCDYRACQSDTAEGGCVPDKRPFALVGQPVVTIGLEAAAGAPRLTRVSFIYDGDSQIVKNSLVEFFGPALQDASEYNDKTWTHGRRAHWRSGDDSMGLLMTTGVITLSSSAPVGAGESAHP
ncbi:MAG: hypothetical protein HRT77_03180 [Halioglobus sp.]|nr:hypothetical protein [Halioglobus sp.]